MLLQFAGRSSPTIHFFFLLQSIRGIWIVFVQEFDECNACILLRIFRFSFFQLCETIWNIINRDEKEIYLNIRFKIVFTRINAIVYYFSKESFICEILNSKKQEYLTQKIYFLQTPTEEWRTHRSLVFKIIRNLYTISLDTWNFKIWFAHKISNEIKRRSKQTFA